MAAAVAAVAALLVSCGDDAPVTTGPGQDRPTTTTRAAAALPYAAELTTSDGNRYRITLALGARSAAGAPDECPPGPPTAGRTYLPVIVTVANLATDRPAPFPPLRVELAAAPGTKPAPVQVRDAGGTCTFAPRVGPIAPGATVVFKGTSPAIDEAAAAGAAGAIEVRVSESAFALSAPVP